jgi:plastocyanin
MRRLVTPQSRRQVLRKAAKGTLGGLGVTTIARGLGNGQTEQGFALAARAQSTFCAPDDKVKVRPDIYSLTPQQLTSLRRGVAVMKARSETLPTSWIFQANMHANPAIRDPEPKWCQHTSWFFFPWHRMYLYWFERILRDASGDPELTLPYWNYTDDPAHRFLPEALRVETDEDGNPNPLLETQREPLINQGWGLPESAVATDVAFASKDFFHTATATTRSFGGGKTTEPSFFTNTNNMGRLEIVPHGQVHVQVGGAGQSFSHAVEDVGTVTYHCSIHPEMVGQVNVVDGEATAPVQVDIFDFGFDPQTIEVPVGTTVTWNNMGDFPHTVTADDGTSFESVPLGPVGLMRSLFVSARDPIFWMHHANIDRLWNKWLTPAVGGTNPASTETEWLDQDFEFYKEDGSPVTMYVRDVLEAETCLRYRYEDEPSPAPPATPVTTVAVVASPAADMAQHVSRLGESAADRPIQLGAERVAVPIELDASADDTVLRIAMSEATPVAGAVSSGVVLTLEGIRDRGAPAVTYEIYLNLPPDLDADPRGEYFVGVVNVFGLTAHMHHRGEDNQNFEIAPVVRTLQNRGDWSAKPVVTFVPRGLVPPQGVEATPAAVATALVGATAGPWISIDRISVSAVES